MGRPSEFKQCRCGYSIIVYVIEYEKTGKAPQFRFFDGHSGDYQQCFVCPGCHDRLDYMTLEG
jgi:hypothetical protein